MRRGKLLVALAHGKRLRRLDEPARALGIFFDIHVIPLSLPEPPLRHGYGIFVGFPRPALTFLNRVRSSPTLTPAWSECGKGSPETEEVISQIRVRWRQAVESPKK